MGESGGRKVTHTPSRVGVWGTPIGEGHARDGPWELDC